MSGADHYRCAEDLLDQAREDIMPADRMALIAEAQVHATLALMGRS